MNLSPLPLEEQQELLSLMPLFEREGENMPEEEKERYFSLADLFNQSQAERYAHSAEL